MTEHQATNPDDPLWKHLRCEILEKEGNPQLGIPHTFTESVVLVGGWPKRTMITPMALGNWLSPAGGFPRATRVGDRLTIEITHAQACYRIVREIDDLLELELVGSS